MLHLRNDGKSWTLIAVTDESKTEVYKLCRQELGELFHELVDEGFATDEIDGLQQRVAELQQELIETIAAHRKDLERQVDELRARNVATAADNDRVRSNLELATKVQDLISKAAE